ncbi:hypothetical protein MMC20_000165 [Loxospora ochrophaea]|nr:hypothetical protein [Loxospora ochrophaea]
MSEQDEAVRGLSARHKSTSSELHHPPIPAPPQPSSDPGIVPKPGLLQADSGEVLEDGDIDIFSMTPFSALKILCTSVETLVRFTGDVPPTPPASQPNTPLLGIIHDDVEDVMMRKASTRGNLDGSEDHEGVPLHKTPIGSPEAGPTEPDNIVGANVEPLSSQHGAIIRKFYSKRPPPISLEEYLVRLHRYCPMSTGVYLATALYVYRLAVIEKNILVTERNVHRLLLAGLRVAMKALEDLSYPHRRFAKVGGVSEVELGRLEISFCFLTNFDLKVNAEMLSQQAHIKDEKTMYKLSTIRKNNKTS